MIAAGLGCAFERDGWCSEGGLIAGGAVAVQLVVRTDDCFCAAVPDHERMATASARLRTAMAR